MPIFGKVPREYLFDDELKYLWKYLNRLMKMSTRFHTLHPPMVHHGKSIWEMISPFKHWSYYRYQPDTSTHFKLPFWIRWSPWFNKIWKWKNHLSFKRMILEAQATRTINIFIRLNDKMMNIGFHLNLVIHFRRLQWTKLHFSYIPYISAGWDTLLYIEIRSLYIILHLFLDVPINPTKFYHKMNSNN